MDRTTQNITKQPTRKERLPVITPFLVFRLVHASNSVGYYLKSSCKKRGAASVSTVAWKMFSVEVACVSMNSESIALVVLVTFEANMPFRYVKLRKFL